MGREGLLQLIHALSKSRRYGEYHDLPQADNQTKTELLLLCKKVNLQLASVAHLLTAKVVLVNHRVTEWHTDAPELVQPPWVSTTQLDSTGHNLQISNAQRKIKSKNEKLISRVWLSRSEDTNQKSALEEQTLKQNHKRMCRLHSFTLFGSSWAVCVTHI